MCPTHPVPTSVLSDVVGLAVGGLLVTPSSPPWVFIQAIESIVIKFTRTIDFHLNNVDIKLFQQMRVAINSTVHDVLKGTIEGVHMSVYLFNVTNAEQFMAGDDEKLKVEEVGPFTYRQVTLFYVHLISSWNIS